jgi:hypothetical protein
VESAPGDKESEKFYSEVEPVSPKLIIGYHTFGSVESSFSLSLAKAVRYCGSFISHVYAWPGPYVVEARNRLLQHLLETGAHAMLMIDADEEFLPENVLKTWAVASLTGADIVWGNYALGDFRNSIFEAAPLEKQEKGSVVPQVMFDLEPNMIYENVLAGGTGWLYVTREAALKMKEAYKDDPWPWFNRDKIKLLPEEIGKHSLPNDSNEVRGGEDVCFGLRASRIGLKQIGYTGLVMTHIKKKRTAPAFMAPYMKAHGGMDRDVLFGKTTPLPKKKEKEDEVAEDSTEGPREDHGHHDPGQGSGSLDKEGGTQLELPLGSEQA